MPATLLVFIVWLPPRPTMLQNHLYILSWSLIEYESESDFSENWISWLFYYFCVEVAEASLCSYWVNRDIPDTLERHSSRVRLYILNVSLLNLLSSHVVLLWPAVLCPLQRVITHKGNITLPYVESFPRKTQGQLVAGLDVTPRPLHPRPCVLYLLDWQ